MNGTAMWMLAAVLTLGGGWMAFSGASVGTERPNCPGRIICPETGEPICLDQCPLEDDAVKPCCVLA